MNKVQGLISEFVPVREEGTRIVISYGLEAIGEEKATWVEVYLPKKKNPMLTLDMVKEAIIADIDSQTDEKILTGFVWEDNEGVERIFRIEAGKRGFFDIGRFVFFFYCLLTCSFLYKCYGQEKYPPDS